MSTAYMYVWMFVLIVTSVQSQSPVFLVNPVSVAAVDGTTVEFSCTANNTGLIDYTVNYTSATTQSVVDKGFTQLNAEVVGSLVIRRNLTVTVSSLYNNTEILCRAFGSPMNTDSGIAILIVQGYLSSVSDLSSSFINPSTVNISWSPPFTLPGTAITGYNISVTSNGTTTNYFTSDSYYVLQWSDSFKCDDTSVAVSGYNGLDGELQTVHVWQSSVPPSEVTIPVSVIIDGDLQLTVVINVTIFINICVRPSSVDVDLFSSSTIVANVTDIMMPQDPEIYILTVNTALTVLEDQRYTAVVSFSNLAGEFQKSSEINFTTFGVESVVITNTTGGRVCLECSFSSFSTDTGCTVELLITGSNIVQYNGTINRSGSGIAEGCVSGVTEGVYDVKVYDHSSSTLIETFDRKTVTEQTTITTTSTGRRISSTTTATSTRGIRYSTSTSTRTVRPSKNPISDNQTTMYIYISVPIGVVIIILIVVLVTLVACVVWQKNRNKGCGVMKDSSNAFLADCNSEFDSTAPPSTTSQPQSIDYLYAKPNKKPTVVEPVVYADLSEIKKKSRPSPAKNVDCKVVYSDLLIKGQPPPPPYEPVELKQVTNLQASVTVIPAGVKVDDSEFNNEIVEMRLPHMNNYQEAVEQRVGNNYPPAPEGRAPSPPTAEDDDQPPPIPGRHLPDLIQNNHSLSNQEEGFTDESMHPALGELTSEKEELQHGGHFMNTPTATYL